VIHESAAMHLAEISQAVAQGAHAVMLMDQAGWHSSAIGMRDWAYRS
jgi:hypothetical protein